jgi:nucleoside 2-deoxyribosyltransferase
MAEQSSSPPPPSPTADRPRSERPRCYLASPLGFNEAGRRYYEEVYLPALATVVTPVDPWTLTLPAEIEAARDAGRLRELWLDIGRRNTRAIRSCELLVAWLDGQEADSGTAAELGYAAALGRICFGLRSDLRQMGEERMAVNLQVESFVLESGGRIAATLEELLDLLRQRTAGGAP